MLAAGPPCRMPAPGSLQASELGVPLAAGLGMAGKVDKIPLGSVRTSCCGILWSCTDVYPFDGMLYSTGVLKRLLKNIRCQKLWLTTSCDRWG